MCAVVGAADRPGRCAPVSTNVRTTCAVAGESDGSGGGGWSAAEVVRRVFGLSREFVGAGDDAVCGFPAVRSAHMRHPSVASCSRRHVHAVAGAAQPRILRNAQESVAEVNR